MINYYFCIDCNTQWFCKLLIVDSEKASPEFLDFEYHAGGEFLNSIQDREISNWVSEEIRREYYCWSLSAIEFFRLKRINELYPKLQEYNKLVKNYD